MWRTRAPGPGWTHSLALSGRSIQAEQLAAWQFYMAFISHRGKGSTIPGESRWIGLAMCISRITAWWTTKDSWIVLVALSEKSVLTEAWSIWRAAFRWMDSRMERLRQSDSVARWDSRWTTTETCMWPIRAIALSEK